MTKKRKISFRKVAQLALTVIVTMGCIVAMVSASSLTDHKTLKKVAVQLKNGKKYHFIDQKEIIEKAIVSRHIDILKTPMGMLDLQSMEKVLKADPWIAEVQVFVDNDCVLNINVTQRIPVARLFNQNNSSYYMDAALCYMPLSENNIYYTSVVTNVPECINDSACKIFKSQLYSLIKTIQADTFWNNQISQIVIDTGNTFDLIPVLGNQKIVFGDTSRMKEKFNNLFAFYSKVLNYIGWDKYETLDLRFTGQVIASPSLPYNGPTDKAVSNMNWINSIVETEAKNEAIDTLSADDSDSSSVVKTPIKKEIVAKAREKPEALKKEKPEALKKEKKDNIKHNKKN